VTVQTILSLFGAGRCLGLSLLEGALVNAGAEWKWRNGRSVPGVFEAEFSRTTESHVGKGTIKNDQVCAVISVLWHVRDLQRF